MSWEALQQATSQDHLPGKDFRHPAGHRKLLLQRLVSSYDIYEGKDFMVLLKSTTAAGPVEPLLRSLDVTSKSLVEVFSEASTSSGISTGSTPHGGGVVDAEKYVEAAQKIWGWWRDKARRIARKNKALQATDSGKLTLKVLGLIRKRAASIPMGALLLDKGIEAFKTHAKLRRSFKDLQQMATERHLVASTDYADRAYELVDCSFRMLNRLDLHCDRLSLEHFPQIPNEMELKEAKSFFEELEALHKEAGSTAEEVRKDLREIQREH